MRRLALICVLALTLPPEATAQGSRRGDDPFCTALRQVVNAAGSGFDYLPRNQRLLPGSVEERRGITRTGDGPPRAVVYAIMLRDNSGERPSPAAARFQALQAAISRCLPDAQASPPQAAPRGATAAWTLPMALIGLRRDEGEGFASSAEVEISVASRW
ncbi:MAG: hypothetical protein K2X74_12515 [Acetobacteraceae bacterium]|nr:hypothetical protein [Acetobacteraceae bacterium]